MKQNPEDHPAFGHILYLIVLPPQDSGERSPFQGFSINAFGVTESIQHVCTLPATTSELFLSRADAIKQRSAGLGGYAIALLELEFLDDFAGGLPVTCFISDAQTRAAVERHIAARGRRTWLHLTTDTAVDHVPKLLTFSRFDMYRWSRGVAKQIIAEEHRARLSRGKRLWNAYVKWPHTRVKLDTRRHSFTLPTETALMSLGFSLGSKQKPLIGAKDDDCAHAISNASQVLEQVRSDATPAFKAPGLVSLIVAVPSVYRHLSPKNAVRRETPKPAKKAIRHVLRQQQYVAMTAPAEEASDILKDQSAMAILHLRAQELRTYTAALSVSAASLLAPVLRLPPQIDRVRSLLIRLAGLSRGAAANIERRNTLARSIGIALRDAIPISILERIDQRRNEGIKLIGDTPLELVLIDDLPMCLRASVSRLPTLPGNLLMRQALMRTPTFLHAKDLRRVLVIRAFSSHDPLRDHLMVAAREVIKGCSEPIDLRVVDVQSRDELVAAFNEFDGPLAIFDGHGSHDRTDPQGTLTIGSVKFNPYELYGKIRVPPIVFLSACETYTLEGMESSVAGAFLFMGAQSVLGTLVPIDGLTAGILIARFLLRFSDFLPLFKWPIPWTEVVSGMLRMSYVTDVVRALEARFQFGETAYRRIHTDANAAINSFQPDWFESLLASISKIVSLSEQEIREIWLRTCFFTETLHYVHLGQPEHLFVVPA
jgi:hypothetical protein